MLTSSARAGRAKALRARAAVVRRRPWLRAGIIGGSLVEECCAGVKARRAENASPGVKAPADERGFNER
jgi:hypothetical protein